MNKKEFLRKLEDILELDDNTLNGTENLEELDDWDSLAVMSFIAMVDEDFGIAIDADGIMGCKTINDLADLLGDQISEA